MQIRDAVVALEKVSDTTILALDLSNTFYLIDTNIGETLIVNENQARQEGGTYCEVIRCLSYLSNTYFVTAKWSSEINSVQLSSVSDLEEVG